MSKKNTTTISADELLNGTQVEFKCWDELSDEVWYEFEFERKWEKVSRSVHERYSELWSRLAKRQVSL